MSRLRASLPVLRNASGCDRVAPVNGIGRSVCGWRYGPLPPGIDWGVIMASNSHWEGAGALVNDDPHGRDFNNNPFPFTANPVQAHGECHKALHSVVLANGGYMQGFARAENADINPRFGLYTAKDYASVGANVDFDGYVGASGAVYFNALGIVRQGQLIGGMSGQWAVEIRPSDKQVRGWSDPGGDARVTGVGVTTAVGPFYPLCTAYNGQNGFKGHAYYGPIVICGERAINFNVPAARSVRITVNGVVQQFAGPVNYLNLSGAGVGSFDPAAGIWWPSVVRFELFTAAALGGVLLADLTIQRAWGGDTIGMV